LLSAATNPLPHERNLSAVLTPYAPAVLLLIVAAGLWILTAPLLGLFSRGVDTSVSMGNLSRSDLYSFAFVFLDFFSCCLRSQMPSTGFTISPPFPIMTPHPTRVFRTSTSLLDLV
jgi:hypothetical protein